MLKRLAMIVLCCAMCLPPFAAPAHAAGTAVPHIAVTHVPVIGDGTVVEGYIWFESSAGSYTDYAVTMALEVTRDGAVWGPKPTYAQPSVPVKGDGGFTCTFVSGGYDLYAERLYIWLVPSGFVPDGDFDRTEAAALDKVVIDRYEDGTADIRQTPAPSAPATAVNIPRQKHPKDTAKLSICYSPYTNGLSPETNSAVPIEQMRWQLNLIYPYVDTIRLFGVDGELEKIYKPAKEEYKMRIIAGCWIGAGYSETQIYAQLDKLIELANKGYADIAVVGSETIYRGDLTVSALTSYISYVRERITNKAIPVGTSDTAGAFLDNPRLVESCDVILCTIYPFFDGVSALTAADSLIATYDSVLAVAGGRQVIISECGWPTGGSAEGAAVPGITGAKELFEATYKWSRANDVEIVYFSEIDEAWKVEGTNGDVGTSWGHFTSVGMLKDAYLPVYQTISSAPVLDAATVRWAEDAIQELVSLGVVNANGPSLYEPLVPITRGDFIHYLAKTLALEDKTGRIAAGFTDVDPNMYYSFTIGAGQKAGLVLGMGGGLCAPGIDITRQEMLTLIYRALKYAGMELTPDTAALTRFSDNALIADYARDAISALAGAGLVIGDPGGNVNPLDTATRAEAAVLLYRVYKYSGS